MTESRSGPYIWVTWLSRLLVGDLSCEWASWFRAHHVNYAKKPSGFDAVKWQIDHTALLNETRDKVESEGRSVLIESQNHFVLRGGSGTALGGKPDMVALDADGKGGTVYDVKTGRRRESDAAQVMIYMYALPHLSAHKGRRFDGKVVYADGGEASIPADAVDGAFRDNLHALIRRIAASQPARRVPSVLECAMCDLTLADCPDRVDEDTRETATAGADF